MTIQYSHWSDIIFFYMCLIVILNFFIIACDVWCQILIFLNCQHNIKKNTWQGEIKVLTSKNRKARSVYKEVDLTSVSKEGSLI